MGEVVTIRIGRGVRFPSPICVRRSSRYGPICAPNGGNVEKDMTQLRKHGRIEGNGSPAVPR